MDIFEACKSGDLAAVKEAIDNGADVNATDKDGNSPLIIASKNNNTELTKLLLYSGAKVLTLDKYGRTPLMLTQNEEIEGLLIQCGATLIHPDPMARDKDGCTPFILLCKRKWVQASSWPSFTSTAFVLLDHGSDIDARDNEGKTPLIWASINGLTKIVKLLIWCGTDINAKDNEGNTALNYARNDEIAQVLIDPNSDATLKKLLDPNYKDVNGHLFSELFDD
jgi:ankyrin repeat protein